MCLFWLWPKLWPWEHFSGHGRASPIVLSSGKYRWPEGVCSQANGELILSGREKHKEGISKNKEDKRGDKRTTTFASVTGRVSGESGPAATPLISQGPTLSAWGRDPMTNRTRWTAPKIAAVSRSPLRVGPVSSIQTISAGTHVSSWLKTRVT